MVGHTARLGHIAQLRAVHQHLAAHGPRAPCRVLEADLPALCELLRALEAQPLPDRELLLGRGKILEDLLAHLRLEEDVAHPAGLQVFVAPIMLGQGVRELAEDAAAQAVIAVDGGHAGGGQHAAEPGRLFHYQRPRPAARGLNSGRSAGGSTAHHKDINTLSTGNQRKKRNQRKGYSFHNVIKNGE